MFSALKWHYQHAPFNLTYHSGIVHLFPLGIFLVINRRYSGQNYRLRDMHSLQHQPNKNQRQDLILKESVRDRMIPLYPCIGDINPVIAHGPYLPNAGGYVQHLA